MEKSEEEEYYTLDGSVDRHGSPAIRTKTGTWSAGILLLGNQGLITLTVFGVHVNLVLFLTRVMGKDNSSASNDVNNWTGTLFICSLLGAFFGDSYWGRYRACLLFQIIFVIGLASLSLTSYLFLAKPKGCGDKNTPCGPHSTVENALFYVSVYLVAVGNGAYQPIIATFGADQFDEAHPKETHSKMAFFSYFYLSLNLGCLVATTILTYLEDRGMWTVGFGASAGSAIVALVLFLVGTPRYRYFLPKGNPFSRFCQVIVAAVRKWRVEVPLNGEDLQNGNKSLHSYRLKFLDKAAVKTEKDELSSTNPNPWRLCSATQVADAKSILLLLPIWLTTIFYSIVFTQMFTLFVVQGAAMSTAVSASFHIPAASMSVFNIIAAAGFVLVHRRIIDPIVVRLRSHSGGLSDLERMGISLIIAAMSVLSAAVVEHFRLIQAAEVDSSRLSILWQIPQYMLIGVAEIYMLVSQLEFFNAQAPEGLKSFGSALSMTSIAVGNYASSLIMAVVMKISTAGGKAGWIPRNLNRGHLDWFFYLIAALMVADLAAYVVCAKWYRSTVILIQEPKKKEENEEGV